VITWAMEHPYLTFVLILALLATIESAIVGRHK